MKIGLVGGTGREGSGLAMRWARAGHEVVIGSRDGARGEARAKELSELAGAAITGGDNLAACDAEVVVVCVPYGAHRATMESIKDAAQGRIVVDITVPLKPPKVSRVQLPEGQAAALESQAILGPEVRVVAALHHISSEHLGDVDHAIDCDVLTCADDPAARKAVIALLGDLGLRGIDAGPLCNAIALESLTPVLIHINKTYKAKGTGIRITGLPATE